MSSSSDEENCTLQERQENAVLAYDRLGHHELLRESVGGFKQVCEELEAIFRNEGIWMYASKKFQRCIAEGAAAAIAMAGSVPGGLDLISRTFIRAMAQNHKFQKKYRTDLSNAFRDAAIMSRRRGKREDNQQRELLQLPDLPSELHAVIFGLLASPIDLARCRAVCSDWRDVCDSYSDVLWPRHLRAMVGWREADRLLSGINSNRHGERPVPGAEMRMKIQRLVSITIDNDGHILDPFRYRRFIVETQSNAGYFLRQMNDTTFARLLRTAGDKALCERRCFVSPAEVAVYLARPVPSTLMQLVQMAAQRRL